MVANAVRMGRTEHRWTPETLHIEGGDHGTPDWMFCLHHTVSGAYIDPTEQGPGPQLPAAQGYQAAKQPEQAPLCNHHRVRRI